MSAARSRRANDKHNHLQRTPILVMGCSLLAAPAANADGLSNEDALLLDFLIGKTLNDDVANADDTFALPKGTEITREIALDAKKHDALLLLTMSVD